MSDESEARTFQFSDNTGEFVVKVSCDSRYYDPSVEAYRPVYSYAITGPEWEYVANDLRGAVNEVPNVTAASQSLFAFLYACQEGIPHKSGSFVGDVVQIFDENADLFPPHVRDWAYIFAEQIELVYGELVEEVNKGGK